MRKYSIVDFCNNRPMFVLYAVNVIIGELSRQDLLLIKNISNFSKTLSKLFLKFRYHMYPGREALLPGPGGGSKQVDKSPVTKVSGGAKTSGPKWMHTLMCVKWKREKVFLSSKMKCNQSLTDTNILSAKRKKNRVSILHSMVYGRMKLENL